MPIEKQDVSYKTALGLESDPFSPVPDQDQDQRFYYAFEAFEQRLTLLKRLVRGKDVLILVIGELGSGKTTLLNRYLASADAAWKTCRLRTPSTADPKRRQLLKNLNNHPAYLLKDAGDPVIIIDDAHKLTRIELQFLLQDALAPDSARKVKRLVLVGESGLNATFAALAAKIAGETAVNKIYLPSISVEEAGAYLRHRLAVAGFAGKSPLSASVVKKLHRKTGGLPGKINASAHWWLKNTYAHDNRSRGIFSWIERRRLLILGGATAGACALGLVWILSMSDRNESSLQTAHPTSTPRVVRVKIPPEGRIIRPKSDIATTPANIQKDRRSVIVANSEKKTAPVKIPPPATVTAPKNDKSTPVKTAVAPKTTAVKKGNSTPVKTAVAPKTTAVKKGNSTPAKTTVAPKTTAVKKGNSTPAKTVIPPNAAAIKKKSAAANTADRKTEILREKWLLKQNPRHYTIQILAVRQEKSLLEFIEETRLNNRGRVAYFRSQLKGKDWYRLLYGVYPSKKGADSELNNLPSNIRQLSPWIRRIAPIQRAIKENVSQ
jgi:septal ring-binding cell division protein DamX/type II secretory pathway predicted ATPase ExeA